MHSVMRRHNPGLDKVKLRDCHEQPEVIVSAHSLSKESPPVHHRLEFLHLQMGSQITFWEIRKRT